MTTRAACRGLGYAAAFAMTAGSGCLRTPADYLGPQETGETFAGTETGEPDPCGDGEPNPGTFCFGEMVVLENPGIFDPRELVAAKLDGDGILDLAVFTKDLATVAIVFRGLGEGAFDTGAAYGANTVALDARYLGVGDVTGDGWPDLIATDRPNEGLAHVLQNDGAGGFDDFVQTTTAFRLQGHQVGEFDGVPGDDLLASAEDTQSIVVLPSSGGGLVASPAIDVSVAPFDPDLVRASDLDGDGDLDLVVVAPGDATLLVLRNTGTTYDPPEAFDAGSLSAPPESMIVHDLDGDEHPDVVLSIPTANRVDVLYNAGDGTFGDAVALTSGAGPVQVLTGDFDGDAVPDLATVDSVSNTISVFATDPALAEARLELVAPGIIREAVAEDFDGDGLTDLAFAIETPGQVGIWLARP